MICEYYNKLTRICECTYDVKPSPPETEIDFHEVIGLTVLTFSTFVALTWWMVPLRYMKQHIPNKTFYCKKADMQKDTTQTR